MGLFLPRRWRNVPTQPCEVDWARGFLPYSDTLLVSVPGFSLDKNLKDYTSLTLGSTWQCGFSSFGSGALISDANSSLDLGTGNLLNTTEYTLLVARVLLSTSPSDSQVHGYKNSSGDATNRVLVHYPYSDGTIYFDFGNATSGSGRISVAGQSFSAGKLDAFAFIAGSTRGREIWRNGSLIASNVSATASRPTTDGVYRLGCFSEVSLTEVLLLGVVVNKAIDPAVCCDLTKDPWQLFKPQHRVLYSLPASGSYVLTAEAGSYALTGGAALFNTAMSASGDSCTATGGDVFFSTKLAADQGGYSLSGGDAAFPITWSGESGSCSLSGGEALFAINWIASGGSYTMTGGDAVFQYGSGATLVGEAGDYVLTGGDATFKVTFVGAGESYAMTCGEASFSAGVACGAGTYTYTGGAASFALNAVCGASSYALSGGDTVLNIGFVAGGGAYTYAGGDATFNYSSGDIIMTAEAGAYVLTGGDAHFVVGLAAGAGNYNWSGGDAAWAVNWVGAGGSYVLTGGAANFVDSGNQSVANLLRTQSVYLRLVDGTYYLRLADPTTYTRLQ